MSELSEYEQRMRIAVLSIGVLFVLLGSTLCVLRHKFDKPDEIGTAVTGGVLITFGIIAVMVATDGVE